MKHAFIDPLIKQAYDAPNVVAERIIQKILNDADLALLLDVDGALVEPNDHHLDERDCDNLRKLSAIFNGAAAFFTDNDMRMVHRMAPFMRVISEGGARLKLHNNENLGDVIAVPPPFDVTKLACHAVELAKRDKVNHAHRGEKATIIDSNPADRQITIEAKEAGLGLNYGTDQAYKEKAIEFAQILKKRAEIQYPDLELVILTSGTDCIELRPADFEKYIQLPSIMGRDLFMGKKPIIAGDSMTDGKAIQVAALQFGGYGVAIGPSITGMDEYLLGRFETPADWREALSMVANDPRLEHLLTQTTEAQPKRRAPAAP